MSRGAERCRLLRRAARRALRSARSTALAAALLLPLMGCVAPSESGGVPTTFWGRRSAEFADCFEAQLHFGAGLGARVTATQWLQAGALVVGSAEMESNVAPLPERSFGLRAGAWRSERLRGREYGLSPWYASDIAVSGGAAQWRGDLAAERGSELSLQAHFALVGVTLGVDPVAIARLLAGLVGQEEGYEAADSELEEPSE
ncbi:MAG: hypothetical protein JNL90_20175 [Planctomycetes bacterium]|nr:hypothetical protein [Planctomycetota bacterium]